MLKSRTARWLAGGIAAAAVLAPAFVWALFVPLADWLARHDVGSATGALHETALDNARGRLLTLGAGLVAVAALVFTALNFSLLRRNSEQADQWQRRTHELTEQGQVTDRYAKAVEQLGSDKPDVRIGGIYALERIARDSARDHPTVMEVLTAFVREHSREQWPLPERDTDPAPPRKTRPDVQAAAWVIGRRDAESDKRQIDLTGAILAHAILDGAYLTTRRPQVTPGPGGRQAWFAGADFTGAKLKWAHLDHADLTGAHLNGAYLDNGTHLHRAILDHADLTGAHLNGVDLTGADLTGADLNGADLTGADLTGADLTGADLRGARWPEDAPVPEGWERDTGSGRLQRAGTGPAPAEGG